MNLVNSPLCEQKKSNCFAFEQGHCVCLTNTEFKKPCPFFKTRQQIAQQQSKRNRKM